MNCKICGAELSKPGELCNNCMNKLLKEQERKNDKTAIVTVRGTFILLYELIRHVQAIGTAIFMIAILFWINMWQWAWIAIGLFLVIGIISLIRIRFKIRSKTCTIYTTKVEITWGTMKKKRKVIPFDEIEDIRTNVTMLQQSLKIGTLEIRKKTYNLFDKYEYIESVKNIEEVYKQIKEGLGIVDQPTQE